MRSGALIGVEALVRWAHPDHGLVYPDRFIHLAENGGLIDRLTEQVMFGAQGAFRQARLWKDAGLDLQVAVNVSMDNLRHPSFADRILSQAEHHGIDPGRIVAEVTESRMNSQASALDILTRLRLKRMGVSIDDFGTGYSSLSQLSEIPFDELKIDRRFVHTACSDAHLRAILIPSLDMARQLGIKTVAEGIEDEADWFYLRSLGCHSAQGYFIARPMPPERLPEWLQQWEQRRPSLTPAPP